MEFHSAIKKLKSNHVQKMDGNFYVKQNKRLKEDICNFFHNMGILDSSVHLCIHDCVGGSVDR